MSCKHENWYTIQINKIPIKILIIGDKTKENKI